MPDAVREHLARALEWDEAHATFEKAVEGLPPGKRGDRPPGFEHSAWQLVEHLRLAQRDLLDFCANAQYSHTLTWPDDYWPRNAEPPRDDAWSESIAGFTADREELKRLVRDGSIDLLAPVPTGKARQTYLRAILLVIDHNAYHVGQLVALRRAMGAWKD